MAQGRLARALRVGGGRSPLPALWSWASTLASVGQDDANPRFALPRKGSRRTRRAGAANNLAVLREVQGDVARAEAMLRAALAEDAALPQISKNLADILYRNGRYDDAREAYERAAKLSPELGDDLYFKLGNIAYRRRDHERARESWRRATELNPGHELARANLEMLGAAS